MQLKNSDFLYVVTDDGDEPAKQTLRELARSIQGGLSLDDVAIFTEEQEANMAAEANFRRAQIGRFSNTNLCLAAKIVLVDADGSYIDEITFVNVSSQETT